MTVVDLHTFGAFGDDHLADDAFVDGLDSIVALSVSISAMMSPEETVSPSLTSHLASVAFLHGRRQRGHQVSWMVMSMPSCLLV